MDVRKLQDDTVEGRGSGLEDSTGVDGGLDCLDD